MQKTWANKIISHKIFYLLLLPTIAYLILFSYVPMYGIVPAFKDFNYSKGIIDSPWIGLDNFRVLFDSLGRLVFEFLAPILLALLLNEVMSSKLKRVLQTLLGGRRQHLDEPVWGRRHRQTTRLRRWVGKDGHFGKRFNAFNQTPNQARNSN